MARHGRDASRESLTFLADADGFDLALMDDREPIPMPSWFHFGYRLNSAREVVDLHDRMGEVGIPIVKPLYRDESLIFVPLRRSGWLRDRDLLGGSARAG
jgi:hypothetical protein